MKPEDRALRDQRIHELRAQGLSQAAISELMGCSQPTVGRVLDPALAERMRRTTRQWRADNQESIRQCADEAIDYYGTECACCGAAENLELDHVNGNGGEHRDSLGTNGGSFYPWLVKNDFPAECEPNGDYELQVLCKPCNSSKRDGLACLLHRTLASSSQAEVYEPRCQCHDDVAVHARGERAPGAKLTEDIVSEIRELYATGEWTMTALGTRFGVSHRSISSIVRRQTWKHVA